MLQREHRKITDEFPFNKNRYWLILSIRIFHKVGNISIFANFVFLLAVYLFARIEVSKCELGNQGVHGNYISRIQTLLGELIFNGTIKTKLAMLAFSYCGEIVKNSIADTEGELGGREVVLRQMVRLHLPSANYLSFLDPPLVLP